MRLLLLGIWLALGWPAAAQLTLNVTAVPASTPAGATLYVAGSFNNWNPAAPAYALQPAAGGGYTLTLPAAVRGPVEFKFTRGSWAAGEALANGQPAPNRSFTIPQTGTATYPATITAWADLATQPGTAAPNVSVLSTAFAMPQLGRSRRIWLYLPPDYATTAKTYPVLYMHDGQNLFDDRTAFSGEWGIDEALNAAHAAGDWGCIVVGIDNGGAQRINEYSPFVNAQYGGGQGDAYLDFIVQTLKPYIDANYRTRPARLSTGLMGSSMGGLISLYGGLKFPEVFGRVGVFSPALWFSGQYYRYARTRTPLRPDPRIYLMASRRESASMARDLSRMADTLALAGFARGAEVDTTLRSDGAHAEWFWRREFPAAYRWLFSGTATALPAEADTVPLTLYPNPGPDSQGRLTVVAGQPKGHVYLLDATGRQVRHARLHQGRAVLDVSGLPAGAYRVRVGSHVRGWVKG